MTSVTLVGNDISEEEAKNFVDYLMEDVKGFKAEFDKILVNNKEYFSRKHNNNQTPKEE